MASARCDGALLPQPATAIAIMQNAQIEGRLARTTCPVYARPREERAFAEKQSRW